MVGSESIPRTPILWIPSAFHRYHGLVHVLHYVNFVTPAVDAIRDPLFFGRGPRAIDVVYLCVAAVVALGVGAYLFSRVDDRIAVEL